MRKDEFPIVDKLVQNSINEVLEKIRAEIEHTRNSVNAGNDDFRIGVLWGIDTVSEIIDKYSGKENDNEVSN